MMLEELVITAAHREGSIEDSAINIAAVSAADMETLRVDNLSDIVRYIPGISVVDSGPRSNNEIILRGLTANGDGDESDSAVGVYMGEVPMFYDFKLLDIERVEVLLGPQGTLYGQGTLTGTVRYIPERPDLDEFYGKTHMRGYDVAHGSGVGYQVDTMLNVPLVKDHLALRGVVGVYNDPGFIDYPYIVRNPGFSDPEPDFTNPEEVDANLVRMKDLNDEDTVVGRLALLARVNDNIEGILTYHYQRTETQGSQRNHMESFGTGKYENGLRFPEWNIRNAHMVSLEVTAQIGDFAELTSASAYSHTKNSAQGDVTDLLLDFEYGYEFFPSFVGYTRSGGPIEQMSQEIRLVSTWDSPLNWIIGAFYQDKEESRDYYEAVPGIPDYLGIFRPDQKEYVSYVETDLEEKAVFGEIGYQFTDAWQVTVGGRYYDYSSYIFGGTDLPLFNADPYEIELRTRGGDAGKDGFIYKANTSYAFNDDFMLYGTYSTGYRIGGPNRVAPCVLPLDPNVQNVCALENELFYGPDETKNKEIGARFSLMDQRVKINVAAFHIDWTGLQVSTTTVNGAVGITGNGPDAVSKGVELNMQALLTDELMLGGSFAYTDAYLTEGQDGVVDGEAVFEDDRLPGSPKYAASAMLNYNRTLENGMDLSFNYSVNYTGKVYSKIGLKAYGEALDDYFLNSASVSLSKESWKLTAFVDNIFDAYAETGVSTETDEIRVVGQGATDFTVRRYAKFVARPRVMGLELSVYY